MYRDKPEGRRVPRISYGETGEGPPGISNAISLASLDIRGFHKHTEETLGNHFSTSLSEDVSAGSCHPDPHRIVISPRALSD
jgi:hypothetical protein